MAHAELSPRQRDALTLIEKGYTNRQIARTLGISERTVKVHVNILYQKLGVRSRPAARAAGQDLLGMRAWIGQGCASESSILMGDAPATGMTGSD